jgi:hypothetical protein
MNEIRRMSMAKAWKQYTREMAKKFGYFATWEPGVPLQLGDVGVIRKNLFTRLSGLEDLGLTFQIRDDETPTQISHASSGKVNIMFKGAGKPANPGSVLKDAQAGATIEFSKENATVFEAADCRSSSVRDQIGLGRSILDLYARGKWNKDWVVVTDLIRSDSATILISAAKDAKLELSASGAVAAAGFNLADASLGFNIEFMANMHTKIIAAPGQSLTPLFKASGLKSYQALSAPFAAKGVGTMDLESPAAGKPNLYFGNIEFDMSVAEPDPEASRA